VHTVVHSLKKVFTFTIAGLGVLTFIVSMSPLALAQTTTTTEEPRCAVAKDRLTALLEAVTTTNAAHTSTYTQSKETIDALITRATDRGYDTATMTAAQTAVETKVKNFTEKATAYKTALMATSDAACGESEEAFLAALTSARNALTEVRTAATEVKTTFIDQAKPALAEYANWLLTQIEANPEQGQST
jgi:hypothetical protein